MSSKKPASSSIWAEPHSDPRDHGPDDSETPTPVHDMSALTDVVTASSRLEAIGALSFFLGYHVSNAANGDRESAFLLREFVKRHPKYSLAILINVPELYPGRSFVEH